MEGTPHPIPRTVEEVFSDFKARRAGLIKALTNGSCFSFLYMHTHAHMVYTEPPLS